MNAPFFDLLTPTIFVVVALVLGFFFGFFLERAGFSSARKLTAQFFFKDFAVLKVMFTAIIVAMLGLAYLSLTGQVDMSRVYITPTWIWPQIIGGLLLGSGFAVGGYCPGTSPVAAAIGRLDALFFMLGILLGTALFGIGEPSFKPFYESGAKGPLTLPLLFNLNTGLVALLITLVAVGAFWIAEKSEGPWHLFARTYGPSAAEEKK
jgi:hypothetical protein